MKNSLLGSTAIAITSLAFAAPAHAAVQVQDHPPAPDQLAAADAQPAQPAPDTAAPQSDSETPIVVTGSRIRRPNLESTVPITSVGGEEFFQTGDISVGDTLNQFPRSSTFSQSNSTRFLGTAGLNLLDLRGLGTRAPWSWSTAAATSPATSWAAAPRSTSTRSRPISSSASTS